MRGSEQVRLLRTIPGARPSPRVGGSAGVAPTQLFGRLGPFRPCLSSKNYAAPPPGLPPGPLGLLPKPVLRSCGFSFAGSLQILVPCPTEPAPAEPETCGFRLVRLAYFSGSRSAWRHWAAPRMSTQPTGRKRPFLASAHRLPIKTRYKGSSQNLEKIVR